MPDIIFEVKQIYKILRNRVLTKSSGLVGIPSIVLKKCGPELVPIFIRLFQACKKGFPPKAELELQIKISTSNY